MSIHSVRIPDKLDREINILLSPTVSRSELIRNALTQYVKREKFRRLRRQVLPFAESQGLLTDEDVFEAIQ
ncbi:MAG: CopG family transcriptional regulator [bacterium]|nr:CopG family transcriptional regulator [bacterium]